MGSFMSKIGQLLNSCLCCSQCSCFSTCCGNDAKLNYENNRPDTDTEIDLLNGCCYVHRIKINHDKKNL